MKLGAEAPSTRAPLIVTEAVVAWSAAGVARIAIASIVTVAVSSRSA
jgi:hypothetical protein